MRWLQQQHPMLTWSQLKFELMEQFGGDLSALPIELLAALHQLGLFLNGLREEIRVLFRPNDATDLRTAMRVARSITRELDFPHHDKHVIKSTRVKRWCTSFGLGWNSSPTSANANLSSPSTHHQTNHATPTPISFHKTTNGNIFMPTSQTPGAVHLGPFTMTVDCVAFPLGAVDLILGVTWLPSLGTIRASWATMTKEFEDDGQCITLTGDPTLSRLPISFNSVEYLEDVEYRYRYGQKELKEGE
ncbi:ribonuclease Y [Striga asiatica]|uniref:Ribonuclease Y n=1 Tax=Striga asiatica TaxID=4170 RepID=A0A5A7PA75_STRAF|nr:ribonuclease Y [Striga asiatica]